MNKIQIAPSVMCADFLTIKNELNIFKKYNTDLLHIDIMDGHYVPNLTLGIDFSSILFAYSNIPIDFHLMIENIDLFIDQFCSIKNSFITFHPETSRHPVRTIQRIRESGCKPGIAIDPSISLESLKHLIPLVDQVCIMSVNPGYAGQELLPFCIDKITEVKSFLIKENLSCKIEIDGNVSWDNIPKMIKAGAEILVLGSSSIFDKNYTRDEAFIKLNNLIKECTNSN